MPEGRFYGFLLGSLAVCLVTGGLALNVLTVSAVIGPFHVFARGSSTGVEKLGLWLPVSSAGVAPEERARRLRAWHAAVVRERDVHDSDTLASLLKSEPDWTTLPGNTHPRVRELLARCLTKDVRERQRDIGDVRLELDIFLDQPPQHLLQVLDHLAHVEASGLDPLVAREGQQLARELGRPIDGPLHLVEVFMDGVIVVEAVGRELGEALDRGEQVVEVVGDAPSERPHRLHLLCLTQSAGDLPALGDVEAEADHALDASVAPPQRFDVGLQHSTAP